MPKAHVEWTYLCKSPSSCASLLIASSPSPYRSIRANTSTKEQDARFERGYNIPNKREHKTLKRSLGREVSERTIERIVPQRANVVFSPVDRRVSGSICTIWYCQQYSCEAKQCDKPELTRATLSCTEAWSFAPMTLLVAELTNADSEFSSHNVDKSETKHNDENVIDTHHFRGM